MNEIYVIIGFEVSFLKYTCFLLGFIMSKIVDS